MIGDSVAVVDLPVVAPAADTFSSRANAVAHAEERAKQSRRDRQEAFPLARSLLSIIVDASSSDDSFTLLEYFVGDENGGTKQEATEAS